MYCVVSLSIPAGDGVGRVAQMLTSASTRPDGHPRRRRRSLRDVRALYSAFVATSRTASPGVKQRQLDRRHRAAPPATDRTKWPPDRRLTDDCGARPAWPLNGQTDRQAVFSSCDWQHPAYSMTDTHLCCRHFYTGKLPYILSPKTPWSNPFTVRGMN